MRKTGILGGTFNPIHNGHLRIAKEAYDAFGLDRVLVIPSGISYFKADQDVPEGRVRYEMCALACKKEPDFKVSDIEIKREGNSYTFETLSALKEGYPDDLFYYILGADSLAQIKDFKNPDVIFSLVRMAVSVREGYDEKVLSDIIAWYEERFNADIKLFNTENIDISSSMIRDRVRKGQSVKGLVPEEVERYINENELYRCDYQN